MSHLKWYVLLFFVCSGLDYVAAQNEVRILEPKENWLAHTDARNALYHHFSDEAYALLENRRNKLASLTTPDEWKEYQRTVRKALDEAIGPFPQKTPLNAKVVRTVEKDFYRVEHIVYESQPQFYVTSSLFIPKSLKRRDRAPAVIYCSGHSTQGYRSNVYQGVILNLVKKGFVVFAFDPVGQGERYEYYDAEKKRPMVGGPTTQHSYPGTQAFITGDSQARFMIWDGIRAVDYLLTRREVDPLRIGITGRSGGGTQSSYIAAFDERIAAVAPECYLTNFTRLLQSIGPQDAEQNFVHGIRKGIDHGDLLIVRAPKPALMITTTRDIFSIQGARETATEVARAYAAFSQQANFAKVEDDAPHASTKKNREALYSFFQQHLANPGDPRDEELTILTEDEIRVTATGQVSTSLGGETVFSINRKNAERLASLSSANEIVAAARRLAGFEPPNDFGTSVFAGRLQRDSYTVEKYLIPGQGNYVIPVLVMRPDSGSDKVILYLHPAGKAKEASSNGEIEQLVKNGYTVVAPDLPGVGELGPGDFRGDAFIGGISHNIWYTALLVGQSITALQAADILRVVHHFAKSNAIAIAHKELAPVLLHAAAFDNAIESIALIEPLSSFRSLIKTRFYYSPFISAAVPGMLKEYDLPELASTLAPRSLLIVDPINGSGQRLDENETASEFQAIDHAYRANAHARFAILRTTAGENAIAKIVDEWARK